MDIGAYESAAQYLTGYRDYTPKRLYVRQEAETGGDGSSWEQAYNTIVGALQVTSVSDEVWVKEGTYVGPLHLEPRVGVYGGFAGTETGRDQRN